MSDGYDIEAVRREWIGTKTELRPGRYPVEYDPIRRHCQMVGDTNPLFLDPEYASAGKWGEVIAPPVMVDYFAGNGAWPRVEEPDATRGIPTRGDRAINLNTAWEFLKPVRVGDRLSRQTEVVDIYEKAIRLDPKAVWTVTETNIYNQDGELVAVGRNTLLRHRTPEEVAADSGSQQKEAAP
ncbi:MAG: MaoC family dehydratase N-terminal domain-containing protein [Dehalococcoidia bacterium]